MGAVDLSRRDYQPFGIVRDRLDRDTDPCKCPKLLKKRRKYGRAHDASYAESLSLIDVLNTRIVGRRVRKIR